MTLSANRVSAEVRVLEAGEPPVPVEKGGDAGTHRDEERVTAAAGAQVGGRTSGKRQRPGGRQRRVSTKAPAHTAPRGSGLRTTRK